MIELSTRRSSKAVRRFESLDDGQMVWTGILVARKVVETMGVWRVESIPVIGRTTIINIGVAI